TLEAVAGPLYVRQGRQLYQVLSQLSHPRFLGLQFAREHVPGGTRYLLGCAFDRDAALGAYHLLIPELDRLLTSIVLHLRVRERDWLAAATQAHIDAGAWVDRINAQTRAQVC